jgi:hypothetical protein
MIALQVREHLTTMWDEVFEDLNPSIFQLLEHLDLVRLATSSKELQEIIGVYTAAFRDSLIAAAEPIFGPHIVTRLAHVLGRPVDLPPPCEEQSMPQTPPDPDRPGFYLRRDGATSRGVPLMCGGTAIHVHYFEQPRSGASYFRGQMPAGASMWWMFSQ